MRRRVTSTFLTTAVLSALVPVVVVATLAPPAAASNSAGPYTLISAAVDGSGAPTVTAPPPSFFDSRDAVSSADGKVIAFVSNVPAPQIVNDPLQTNLVTDTNGADDVFVWDGRVPAPVGPIVTLLSWNASHTGTGMGQPGPDSNNESNNPVISPDGNGIVFHSRAHDLVDNIDFGSSNTANLYAWTYLNVVAGAYLVNIDMTNTALAASSGLDFHPSVAVNPATLTVKVAFESDATQLVNSDTDPNAGTTQAYVRDILMSQTKRVSENVTGTAGISEGGRDPVISADGSHVAFIGGGEDVAQGVVHAVGQVFVRDLSAGFATANKLASPRAGTTNVESDGGASSPSISADGSFVAFESSAHDLVSDYTPFNPGGQVSNAYWRGVTLNQTRLLSRSTDGQNDGDSGTHWPALSADGQTVVFESNSSNLAPNDTNGSSDVYMMHPLAEITPELVSVASDGVSASNGASFMCDSLNFCNGGRAVNAINLDGTAISFFSQASNITAESAGGRQGIYIRYPVIKKTVLATIGTQGVNANSDSIDPVISQDGGTVTFQSLVADSPSDPNGFGISDTNTAYDIYQSDLHNTVLIQPVAPVQEGDVSVTINVIRVGTNGTNDSVDYETDDGILPGIPLVGDLADAITATAPDDYTQTSGTLHWAPDQITNTVTVPIIDDNLHEGLEVFRLSLSNPQGAATLGLPGPLNNAYIGIIDDDPAPSISITDTSTVEENSGTHQAVLTMTLSSVSGLSATVDVATADLPPDAALAGSDYDAVPLTTISFNPGEQTKTVPVTIHGDTTFEQDEHFAVNLSNPQEATIADSQGVGTIVNDDVAPVAGVLQFSASTYSVAEGGTAELTVTRVGGMGGAVSVDVVAAGGTASAADYSGLPTTVAFADGDTAPKTVSIPTTQNQVPGDKTLDVAFGQITGTVPGAPAAATLTIVNDDVPGTLALAPPASSTIPENGGSTTVQVTRTGGSSGDVTATVSVAGTAGAGERTVAPLTVSFADGDSAPKVVTVTSLDDNAVDGDKTVILSLSGAQGGVSLDPTTRTVTILDDDAPGTLALSAPTPASIAENGGVAEITVTRTGGHTGDVTATVSVAGTAGAGERTVSPLTVSFADGDTAPKVVTVTSLDDNVVDGAKTVILSLTGGQGGVVLDPGTSTVTIVDDDGPGTLALSAPSPASIAENGGVAEITVTRTGGHTGDVTASIDVAGTAGGGERTVSPLTVSFADGDTTPKVVTVTSLDDNVVDGAKTVILSLTGGQGGVGLDPGTSTVTILDDDAPGTLALAAPASASIPENGGSTTVQVTRTGGQSGDVTATVDVAGTAGGGERTVSPLTVSFADGDTAPKVVTVTSLDDNVVDGDKTVILSLSGAQGGVTLDPTSRTVTILDDDGPGTLTLQAPSPASIAENGGVATVYVTRTSGSAGDVTATVSVGGTAGAGDATVAPLTVSFPAGDTVSKTVTVTALDDPSPEPNETVILSLTGAQGGVTLDPGTSTVTIIDDDGPGTLALSPPTPASIPENGGVATVYVTRSGGSAGDVTATVSVGGTAGPGDATVAPLTVSFASGDTVSKTVTVTAIDNNVDAPDKTVVLSLTGAQGGATLDPTTRTVTIVDDDLPVSPLPTVQFTSATFSVAEGAGSAHITLSRSGDQTTAVSVNYATTNGTAGLADYGATSGIATFGSGVTTASFDVPITQDGAVESDETVNLTLSSPVGATLGVPPVAVLTILDDDGAGPSVLQFSSPTYSVGEAGPSASITVVRSGGTGGTVSVAYATSDGTAGSADYGATSGVLTFGPGQVSGVFTVPVVQDAAHESDETVNLTLSNPGGGAVLGSPTAATLTIVDDDPAGGGLGGGGGGGSQAGPASTSWYFAEGTVRPGFVEFLTFQNPGISATIATVVFQAADDVGNPVVVPDLVLSLPAGIRLTLNLADYAAAHGLPAAFDVSTKVTSPLPIVVERPIYFHTGLAGGVDGGHDVIGATAPGTTFLFAEGTVRDGFQEYLTLQNPGTTPATVSIEFPAAVAIAPVTVVVPATSRQTYDVTAHLAALAPLDVSLKVTSDHPIVAERPLYFSTGLAGGVDGGTDVIGAPAPANSFYFAEGTIRANFVEFLTLENPGDLPASVTVSYQATTPLAPSTLSVPAHSRITFNVTEHFAGAPPFDVSVRVTSDQPIVVERPLYFSTDLAGGADGGTDVIGALAPSVRFNFSEGTVRPGFQEYLTLQNPGLVAATAQLGFTFQGSDDGGVPVHPAPLNITVPPQSRVTVDINQLLATNHVPTPINLSVSLAADQPIVAERPMYFHSTLAGGADGGTDVVGYTG